MDKDILKGIKFGIGLLFVSMFAFVVFAFVEPGSSPASNYVIDTSSAIYDKLNEMEAKIDEINSSVGGSSINSTPGTWTCRRLSENNGGSGSVSVYCNTTGLNERVIAGGCSGSTTNYDTGYPRISGGEHGWQCRSSTNSLSANVYCCY